MEEKCGDQQEAQTGEKPPSLGARVRRRRRLEIMDALAKAGLIGGQRTRDSWRYDGRFGRRLGGALFALGPVFSAFGQYLVSRPDVLSMPDCRMLANAQERYSPTPSAAVRQRLAEQLGEPAGTLFSALEVTPQMCGPHFQTHHAWLSDEGPVTVKLVRPEWEKQWALDAPLLSLLAETIGGGSADVLGLEVVADFCESVGRRIDLSREAALIVQLAIGGGSDNVRVPALIPHLSSAKVLTRRRLAGELPSAFAAFRREPSFGSRARADALEAEARKLARRLCRIWLRLALRGCPFPIDWRPEELLLFPDGALALTGGLAVSVPEEEVSGLRDYLVATATGDLDKAGCCLLGGMEPYTSPRAESVRLLLRQAVPFPHGGWLPDGPGDSLAEQAMTHWRLARSAGCRPKASTLAFLRGLCGAAVLAQQLAPNYDAMREALDEERVEALADRLSELLKWSWLNEQTPKYAAALLAAPELFDRLLNLEMNGSAREPPRGSSQANTTKRPIWTRWLRWSLFIGATAVWFQHLAAQGGGWTPMQEIGVTAILLGCALFLAMTSAE